MTNKDEQFTYEELTALCRKQEEYIKKLEEELKTPNDTEKIEVCKERQDYDDLLFQHYKAMDKIRELEEVVRALLYALRKIDVERLVNKNESQHYQEMYAQEYKRANTLFDIVEKSNIDAYEKKETEKQNEN